MNATTMIGGTAILGVVAAAWGKIKAVLGKLRSLVIVRMDILGEASDSLSRTAVLAYMRRHYKCIRLQKHTYGASHNYRKSQQRYMMNPFRMFLPGNDVAMFVKRWAVVFLSTSSGVSPSDAPKPAGSSDSSDGGMVVWFLRGTLDPDELYRTAVEEHDRRNHEALERNSRRFMVWRRFGNRGMLNSKDLDTIEATTATAPDGSIRQQEWRVPLGFDWDDIGHNGGSKNEVYEVADYMETYIREARFWLDNKDWYIERGVPWRRGWNMIGGPGTGKTALVVHIARTLDLPVISIDLSSYNNRDFVQMWSCLPEHTPCIVLIEDIDAVFDGRRNVTDTEHDKGITFDCLLNCMDGVQRNDGVFTIITTNHPEKIDPAIGQLTEDGRVTRAGRIDSIIEVKPLQHDQRVRLAARILKGLPELADQAVEDGTGDTGANFVERCRRMAEAALWDSAQQ